MRVLVFVGLVLVLAACSAPTQPDPDPVTVTVASEPVPSASATSWSDVAASVEAGVAFVGVLNCDGSESSGSGSLITSTLVLTAAHVVDTADTVAVRTSGGEVEGVVVAFDDENDLAIVRTTVPIDGHIFDLAADPPPVGSDVAAIGFPLGDELSITEGIVSSLSGTPDTADDVTQRLLLSVAVNHGNSGGPVVTRDGVQVGVVSAFGLDPQEGERAEGRAYAVEAGHAIALRDQLAAGTAPPSPKCSTGDDEPEAEPWGGDWEAPLFVNYDDDDPLTGSLVGVVADHGHAIDSRDWDEAFSMFSPAMQTRMRGVDVWSAGLATSTWDVLTAVDVTGGGDRATLSVVLRTTQDPSEANGLECTDRALTYLLVSDGSTWLIDGVSQDAEPARCSS